MKKYISCFLLCICFLTLIPVFVFAEDEITDQEAIEYIEDSHGFTNFSDIVDNYNYFFYFRSESGVDYLAVFNATWLLNSNHIRYNNGHLGFFSWSSSLAYYISVPGSDTFELLSPLTQNMQIPFGYEDYDLIQGHFESYDYISNFDLKSDNGYVYSANFESYKDLILHPQPVTDVLDNYSVIGSIGGTLSSAYNYFISPISDSFFTDNILIYVITFVFIAGVVGIILGVFIHGRN